MTCLSWLNFLSGKSWFCNSKKHVFDSYIQFIVGVYFLSVLQSFVCLVLLVKNFPSISGYNSNLVSNWIKLLLKAQWEGWATKSTEQRFKGQGTGNNSELRENRLFLEEPTSLLALLVISRIKNLHGYIAELQRKWHSFGFCKFLC